MLYFLSDCENFLSRIMYGLFFQAMEDLQNSTRLRRIPTLVTDLHFEIHFQGPDVLTGIQKMASTASLTSDPTTSSTASSEFPHLEQLLPVVLKRGRNKFRLSKRGPNGDNGRIGETLDDDNTAETAVEGDQTSIVSSEMTAI